MFTTDRLRESFLRFFESKGHKVVPSDSLVPADDPTVLFTSAGMNQFKPQFMGHITDFTRATSCQKCLRTDDLPQVGKTPYHHTFFEMLGNFSFGDYFKEEAITWAWEYLTEVLGIDPDRLWVSVHKDDEEAYKIWREKIGIPEHKIAKLGDKTNFWPSNAIVEGPNGPCGPCSEIFFDQGENFNPAFGPHECGVDCDCGRFAEIWNLVFTQFDRRDGGVLEVLPQKNIDTGMGLERIAAVMQGKRSNFEIDIFVPIVDAILSLVGKKKERVDLPQVYSIADHIRAVVFAISDGVIPSNESRGYVIRKLIRKSVWHLRQLGKEDGGLVKLVPVVAEVMKNPYPELKENLEMISNVVQAEEERFLRTLEVGLNRLEEEIERAKDSKVLSGKVCFMLYDTYGFPIEMTKAIAEKEGLDIDEEGFNQEMERQRERSRMAGKTIDDIFAHRNLRSVGAGMCFVGYESLSCQTKVRALLKNDDLLSSAKAGEEVDLVLEECPFYGESGGQIGDTGWIVKRGGKARVLDTYRVGDVVVCKVRIEEGEFSPGDEVQAEVDVERRLSIARNHTATHLLQAALRRVLGEHIRQAGSLVAEDRLRFDFTHPKGITKEELERIEYLVNQWVMQDIPVEKMEVSFDTAKEMGALAFFGEKYGERVRVVKVGDVSCELCGGTHLDRTGQIGLFAIVSERSVASGVRRIEATTGKWAYELFKRYRDLTNGLVNTLKVEEGDVLETVKSMAKELKGAKKELEELQAKVLAKEVRSKLEEESVAGVRFVSGLILGLDLPGLRKLWDELKAENKPTVALLAGTKDARGSILLACTKDLAKSIDLRQVLSELKELVNLAGGGRPDFVQVGVKDSEDKLKNNWEKIKERLFSYIGQAINEDSKKDKQAVR